MGQWQRRIFMVLKKEMFLRETYLTHPLILHLLCSTYSHLSHLWMNMHAVLSTESERLHLRVCLHRGSACSTIWPRYSLLPHCLFFSHPVSCRPGNLLNSHIYSELWCCPKHTHRNTSGACWYGPHRSESSFSCPSFSKWNCQGFVLCLHFFYRSGFYCFSLQNIRGCKTQKQKKRKSYTVMLY